MTDWNPPRTVEHRGRSLAFAVQLVDQFTGDEPADGVTVEAESIDGSPVKNPSGYYLFLDLEPSEVTLVVDGGDRYVDQRRRIVVDEGGDADAAGRSSGEEPPVHVVTDPSDPLVVSLPPTPAYEFPGTSTVLRGHVRDGDGEAVERASVSLREFEPVVETTGSGEYALWVPATAEQVLRRDGRNVVVADGVTGNGRRAADGGGGTDPTLVVSHPDYGEVAERIEVPAGTRTVCHVAFE